MNPKPSHCPGHTPLLQVDDLTVHTRSKAHTLLHGVSFALQAGDALTLLGESGAGKSLLAQAIMGNLPASLQAGGSVALCGQRTQAQDGAARRAAWGKTLALLPQEPALALDPLMRIAPQLQEIYQLVGGQPTAQARTSTHAALQASGLAAAAQHYPWQISGGMAQRAAATIAQAGGARIVLADEPTKGLDAHWLQHTVHMLQAVQRAGGCVIVITHDLRVAQALGGQLIVLRAGQVVEQGRTHDVLAQPSHPFTQALIAAAPQNWPRQPAPSPIAAPAQAAQPAAPILSARGLGKQFGSRTLFQNIDLDIRPGERLVIQGPSGTGKSTLGNVLLGLLPAGSGHIQRGPGLAPTALQKLYQDPAASFAPHIRLERALRDVAKRHRYPWADVLRQLARLGVGPDLLTRLPAQISGGELQRIALARVLMTRPALLFADEPTSRLDPITQQEAMQVLLDAASENNAALILVTHDEDIARAVATQTLRFGDAGVHQ